jgi:hypothetical protein
MRHHIVAQGIALGLIIKTTFALKGQNKITMQNPCDALSGRKSLRRFTQGVALG